MVVVLVVRTLKVWMPAGKGKAAMNEQRSSDSLSERQYYRGNVGEADVDGSSKPSVSLADA